VRAGGRGRAADPRDGARSARARRVAALALLGALAATPANAHTLPIGDFYAGLLQPALHLPSLLLVLCVALAATQLAGPAQGALPLAFSAGCLAGGLASVAGAPLPAAPWGLRLGALAVGLAVALRRVPAGRAGLALAALLGLAQGAEALAGEDGLERPLLYALGAAFAPVPVAGASIALVERVRAFWLEVAVRIAGSWIATIALLAGALEAAGR
jgi:hydrogenase/urease accessory protein HupE